MLTQFAGKGGAEDLAVAATWAAAQSLATHCTAEELLRLWRYYCAHPYLPYRVDQWEQAQIDAGLKKRPTKH